MLDKTNWTAKENRTLLEPWRKTLLDAADYMERNGHCQGAYQRDGAVCVLGAIIKTTDGRFDRSSAAIELCKYLHIHDLPRWNDQPGRTKAEVVDVMRECAANAELESGT